jgi:VanZ family protein
LLGALTRWAAGDGRRGWLIGLAAAAVVGAVDEVYQSTVPGRTTSALDWSADLIGGTAGGIAWAILSRLSLKSRESRGDSVGGTT